MGAGPSGAGISGAHSHMTNTLNTPIEELELEYPLEISEYRLADVGSASRKALARADVAWCEAIDFYATAKQR